MFIAILSLRGFARALIRITLAMSLLLSAQTQGEGVDSIASGTYTWNSITGVLTTNWVSSTFLCEGLLEDSTDSGVTVTSTTLTFDGGDVWTRTAGFAGDIVGTWTALDDFGNPLMLTFDTNGAVSIVANVFQCPNPWDQVTGSGDALMTMTYSRPASQGGCAAESGIMTARRQPSGSASSTGANQFDGTYSGNWSLTCPACGDTAAGTFRVTLIDGVFTDIDVSITSGTHGIALSAGTVSLSGAIAATGIAPPQCSGSAGTFAGQITNISGGDGLMSMIISVANAGTGYGDVASSPPGISCYTPIPGYAYLVAPDCSENYTSGTSVTLTATPSAGSTFEGWSGACAGTATCTLTLDAAKTVTATFNVEPPITGNPTDPVTPPPVEQTFYTVNMGAMPDTAATTEVAGTLGSATVTVQLDLSKVLSASFAADSSYNVYVGALVPSRQLGTGMDMWFVKTASQNWQDMTSPIGSYLQNVASGGVEQQIVIEIVRDTDITALIGTEVYIGYGTSDTEMLEARRYRGVYKVQ